MWTAAGARTRTMSPAAHDRAMAWVSHLPHAAAFALAAARSAPSPRRSPGSPAAASPTPRASPRRTRRCGATSSSPTARRSSRRSTPTTRELAALRRAIDAGDAAAIEAAGGARPAGARARDPVSPPARCVAFAAGCGAAARRCARAAQATERPVGEDLLGAVARGRRRRRRHRRHAARQLADGAPAGGAHAGRRARARGQLGDDPLAQVNAIGVAVYKVGTPESEAVTVARGALDWDKLKATIAGGADADYHGAALFEARARRWRASRRRCSPSARACGVRRVCDVAQKNDDGFPHRRHSTSGCATRSAARRRPSSGGPRSWRPSCRRSRCASGCAPRTGTPPPISTGSALSFAVGDGFDVGIVAGAHGPHRGGDAAEDDEAARRRAQGAGRRCACSACRRTSSRSWCRQGERSARGLSLAGAARRPSW